MDDPRRRDGDEFGDVISWAAAEVMADPERVAELGATAPGWGPMIPLGRTVTPPPLPVDTLPAWAKDFVEALAVATQTPTDLAGVLVLAAFATAAGGRAVVEVRPGWREPVNLFAAVVQPPGARKTPVFQRVARPLTVAERDAIDLARPEVFEAIARRDAAMKTADLAQAKAAALEGPERDAAIAEVASARLMAEALTVPSMPRLLADDVTPEAAASLLAEQGGRLAVLSAEGGIFDAMAGRYCAASMPNLGRLPQRPCR